jgi:hypothetical protein
MASRALLDDLFEQEFRVHEAAMADDYASRPDIKNTLLAEFIRRGMTFEEISDNIATVMFAAHDTTASLMQVCLSVDQKPRYRIGSYWLYLASVRRSALSYSCKAHIEYVFD